MLQNERAILTKERGTSTLIKFLIPGERLTRKNAGKLAVLARITDLLKTRTALTTREISSQLRLITGDSLNQATLRSHLSRFKEQGQLQYNEENKKWSLPTQRN